MLGYYSRRAAPPKRRCRKPDEAAPSPSRHYAAGVVVAALLPVYPWRSQVRSQIMGDVITHESSLNQPHRLFGLARSHDYPALLLALDVALCLALAALVPYCFRSVRRRA